MTNNTLSNSDGKMNNLRQLCVYRTSYNESSLRLILMNLSEHIFFMHTWANQFYTGKYWQMEGSFSDFYNHYDAKQKENNEIILIAYMDNLPVAQVEIYPVLGSALAKHVNPGVEDFGFHLLMAPHRELLLEMGNKAKGISRAVLQSALEYLFYDTQAENIMVEPDKENKNACLLAEKAGFKFQREIMLPDKIAALYLYKRSDFLREYPAPVFENTHNLFADKYKK